jgi:hypothetical protein
MSIPNKIYTPDMSGWAQWTKKGIGQMNHEYISVEALKKWVTENTHYWEHSGVEIIKPDELLKFIE